MVNIVHCPPLVEFSRFPCCVLLVLSWNTTKHNKWKSNYRKVEYGNQPDGIREIAFFSWRLPLALHLPSYVHLAIDLFLHILGKSGKVWPDRKWSLQKNMFAFLKAGGEALMSLGFLRSKSWPVKQSALSKRTLAKTLLGKVGRKKSCHC